MDVDLNALSRSAVEQTCRHLMRRAERAEIQAELAKIQAQQAELHADQAARGLEARDAEIKALKEHIESLQLALYAPKSDRSRSQIPPEQERLFHVPVAVVNAADDCDNDDDEEIVMKRRKKKGGRRAIPKELPTKTIVLRASDEERVGRVSLGFEVSESIDFVPERVQRLIIKREKLGLPDTREYVSTVAMPPRLIAGGKATDAFMLHAALRKYELGLPLYRQTRILNRLGADIAENYLGECVRHIADTFAPIASAIRDQVLACSWVFADETPIRALSPPETPPNGIAARTAYLWAWVGGDQVAFHFGATRSSKEVRDVLGIPYDPNDPIHGWNNDLDPNTWERGEWIGFLLCDGYSGYNPLFKSEAIIRAACWVHARRRFLDCTEHDKNARDVVALINQLMGANKRIVREADKKYLPAPSEERFAYIAQRRQEDLPARIAQLDSLLTMLTPIYSPDTRMGRGITYIRNRWDALMVFLNHGCLPMENNTAERAIRPIAVGRKAWLFVGSEDGGHWAATMFSVIESCRLQKLDVTTYCEHVLAHIVQAPDRDAVDFHALTPAALKKTLSQKR